MAINNVSGVRTDITQMLEKIREVSNRTNVFDKTQNKTDFSKIFESTHNVLGNITEMQKNTDALKDKYLAGDPNVSLAQIVVAGEKSKLAFQGLITVRNKCLEAYKEIMSMPV